MPLTREATASGSRKRSVVINGHNTSVSLEDEFWDCLIMLAKCRNQTLIKLVSEVDQSHRPGNLSSKLRLLILEEARQGTFPPLVPDPPPPPLLSEGQTGSAKPAKKISRFRRRVLGEKRRTNRVGNGAM